MIIPIWQKTGQSTHLLAKSVGKMTYKKTNNLDDLKATHTGTLDPMAEGVVIVLTGKDRFKKEQFSDWKKTYEFEILFGVDTDSNDLLGLQTRMINQTLNLDKIIKNTQNLLPSFIGDTTQTQPTFSAQRIDGESAFDKAKKREKITLKKNNIIIFDLKIKNSTTITTQNLLKDIKQKINLVKGDFRQTETIKNWENTIKILEKNQITHLPIINIKTTVSKRTYIRALVRDISIKLDIPATTFHIIRTKNGKYS